MASADPTEHQQTVREKIASGVTFLAFVRIGTRSLDLVTFVVLSRWLMPADFGLVAISISVVQIADVILEPPIGQVLFQLPSLTRSHLNTAFTLCLLRGAAITFVLCLLSVPLATFYHDDRLVALFSVQGLGPAIRSVRSPLLYKYHKDLQFGRESISEMVSKCSALIVAVSIAVLTGSYWAIVANSLMAPLMYIATSYVVAPFRPSISLANASLFRRYIGWGIVGQVISALNWQCDRFVLARLVSHSTFGLFTAARDLSQISVRVILDIINRPILAVLSSIAQDREKLASAYAKATQSTLSMGIPIACGQALVAPEIVRLGLGPNWAGSAPLFQFLSLAIIPLLFSNLTTSLFFAAGRPELVFSRNFLDLLFRIPATVVLTVLFGVTGAVAAMALSEMVLAMICIRSVKQILGLSIRAQLFQPRRSIMSAGSMGLAVEILRWLEPPHPGLLSTFLFLLSAIPAAAISYACMHLLLWQLEGRPDGIERLAITLVGGRVRRFSWSLKAVENADR